VHSGSAFQKVALQGECFYIGDGLELDVAQAFRWEATDSAKPSDLILVQRRILNREPLISLVGWLV
jgi:hypothetical protein